MIQCINCLHDGSQHADEGYCRVTSPLVCMCMKYSPAPSLILRDIFHYVKSIEDADKRIQRILTKVPEARNLNNKAFIFFYWNIITDYVVPPKVRPLLTDPETIRRAKQKVVESNPDKFGAIDPTLIDQKGIKYAAFQEYLLDIL